ncbi:MAG: hypothetical protein Q9203_001769 [Teloschistes exilis]
MDQYDLEAANTPPSTTTSSATGEDDEGSEAAVDDPPQSSLQRWLRLPSRILGTLKPSSLPLHAFLQLRVTEPVVSEIEPSVLERRSIDDQPRSLVHHPSSHLDPGQRFTRPNDPSHPEHYQNSHVQAITRERMRGSYKDLVPPAASPEISAEDERRAMIREKWYDPDLSYIADPWIGLWDESCPISRGLSQWSCSDDDRINLQLQIADALKSGPIEEIYITIGIRQLSCWISLIGLRLNDLYLQQTLPQPSQERYETDSPIVQIRVLIECIWSCNKNKFTTIGNVLENCYRRNILHQPTFGDYTAWNLDSYHLRTHIRAVRVAIYLINVLYSHTVPAAIDEEEDLDEAWFMLLSDAERALRCQLSRVERDMGNDPFFGITDFNLRNIQSLGQLEIKWTSYWDEHLELVTSRTSNVLKLYWFPPGISRYFRNGSVLP